MKVTVYTHPDRPSFIVAADTSAARVRAIVEDRYGWVGIGIPHTWVGVLV